MFSQNTKDLESFWPEQVSRMPDSMRIPKFFFNVFDGSAFTFQHRRIVMLLEYCVDVEKYLLDEKTSEFKGKSAYIKIHKPNRSLSTYFANFLNLLFEEPQSSVGLLPLAMWGAIQFNCEEVKVFWIVSVQLFTFKEFTDYLIEACTKYPYLLIHVYNVCSRFRKEDIAGQLFERVGSIVEILLISSILALRSRIRFIIYLAYFARNFRTTLLGSN